MINSNFTKCYQPAGPQTQPNGKGYSNKNRCGSRNSKYGILKWLCL